MKSAAIATLSIVGAVAVAGVGYGAYQAVTPQKSGYAKVVNVDPIVKTWQEPREVCQQVNVERKKPVKDQHRVTGSVVGAVISLVVVAVRTPQQPAVRLPVVSPVTRSRKGCRKKIPTPPRNSVVTR